MEIGLMLAEPQTIKNYDRRPVLSGRRFTLFFIGLLVACLAIGVPVVLRFEATQDRLDAVRQSWPDAAVQLENRYAAVEQYSLERKIALPAEWQEARNEFRKNVSYDDQPKFANALEKLIESNQKNVPPSNASQYRDFVGAFEQQDYVAFETSQRALSASHSDWLGKLTDFCFRLSAPTHFGD